MHAGVGPISENDILLASASNAVVVGFSIKVETNAVTAAKHEGVQVKLYSIIYELIDQIKEAMAGLLDPEHRETVIGHAEVKQVFKLTKGIVAGCLVTDGRIARTARARVLRRRQPVYDGGLSTLRRFQDDVKEVRSGFECGIKLGDFNEYQVGDIIECYQLEAGRAKAVIRLGVELRRLTFSARPNEGYETSSITRERNRETRTEHHHHARTDFRRRARDRE